MKPRTAWMIALELLLQPARRSITFTTSNQTGSIPMALTPAEKKRAQLERERKAQLSEEDSTYAYLKRPFHDHAVTHANWSGVQLAFGLMGMDLPEMEDDRGPEAFADEDASDLRTTPRMPLTATKIT
ncbi:MAG: hypothetical protein KDE55_24365 [Novosphingobium sp.]|nr:hypothetical protein [Novosphingobium sp.]